MRSGNEPTVEEILESIKKVIARDNRASAAEVRQRRENDGITVPGDAASADDVLDLSASAEYLGDGTDDPQDYHIEDDAAEAEEQPLLHAQARADVRESLAALALLAEPGAQPKIVRSGETSLEGLVRDLLRPALAQWLDANLPPLVERMVADEIRRISARKG